MPYSPWGGRVRHDFATEQPPQNRSAPPLPASPSRVLPFKVINGNLSPYQSFSACGLVTLRTLRPLEGICEMKSFSWQWEDLATFPVGLEMMVS